MITKGYTFGSTELVTNTKLHSLVDDATVAAVKEDGTVNPTNLLSNGDFEAWSAGTGAAPDGWTLAGASASVAREGTIIKLGTYSAKVTRAGTNCQISQNIHTAKGIAYWKGRTVTYGAWVWDDTASRSRIAIYDGVTFSYSVSYHTGDSTWQWMTATKTLSASATAVGIYNLVQTTDGSGYFDGAMCVEGSSAFAFSPKPITSSGNNDAYIYSNVAKTEANSAVAFIKQDNASSTQPVVEIVNDGTGHGLNIQQDGALASNRSGLYVVANNEQDTGLAAAQVSVSSSLSSIPALRLNQSGSGAHINLVGDPTVASPVDGDLWFDGTNLKMRIGTTTYNISMTEV